jgi:GTPase
MKETSLQARNRVVAIVGRPNVGKSAMFNRLAARRLAIVHSEAGVTRDRLMRDVTWEDQRFELIDTGGVCNIDNATNADRIETGIRQQVVAALGDAGLAILVVDLVAGLHPLDLEVAGLLQGSGCCTVVAANKADVPERDDDTHVFMRMGFPVFPVSALHNRGIDALMAPLLAAMPPPVERSSVADPLRVAIVGRPNVGKSSYINRLLRSDRVIVSDVPGTTRDSVDIPFAIGSGPQARHYMLVDTAGMRRAGKVSSAVEKFSLFRAEKSIAGANVVVLVLDALQGPTAQDKKIAALIQEHRKGCAILVNKWDLAMDEVTQRKYGPAVQAVMPFMGHCPIVFASAQTGFNIRRTVEAIDHVATQIRLTLPTGVLNRAIKKAYDKIRPPSYRGRPFKIYYGTQVGTEPLRFRLFVNSPEAAKPQYTNYLVHSLREQFGLEGAPVIVQYKSHHD